VLEFRSSSFTILPLTTAIAAIDDVELECASVCEAASARMAGNISGLAPAITALMATVSTVYCHASRSPVTRIFPTISLGFVMGGLEHRRDRSSVGMTMGSWSVQKRSSKYFWILSAVSGPIRRFFSRWTRPVFFSSSVSGLRQIAGDFLHERLLVTGSSPANVCVQLFPRLSSHGRMSEGEPEPGHSFFIGLVVDQID